MKRVYFFSTLFILLLLTGNGSIKGDNPVKTNIMGHWNHPKNSIQNVYVVSEGEDVELFINGISFGHGHQESDSVYRFANVIFQPGDLTAVSYDADGKELNRQTLRTAGAPAQLKVTVTEPAEGLKANGNDIAVIQFEVADFQGNRCGNDERLISYEIEGPAELLDDDSKEKKQTNKGIFKAENGINRVALKSTKTPGKITVMTKAKGLSPVVVTMNSKQVE